MAYGLYLYKQIINQGDRVVRLEIYQKDYVGASIELDSLQSATLVMDSLIKRVKEAISAQTEDQKKALEEVASLREKISSIKDTKDADSVLAELNGKPKTMAMPLKEALSEKVKELGFKYNKEAKKFELTQK